MRRTNKIKYDDAIQILKNMGEEFMDSIGIKVYNDSDSYYVYPRTGIINKRTIIKRIYNYRLNYIDSTKPTKKDIEYILEKIESFKNGTIKFTEDNIFYDFRTGHMSLKEYRSEYFFEQEYESEAIKLSVHIKSEIDKIEKFKNLHQKYPSYDYRSNQYKFLGWMNGWSSDTQIPDYVNCKTNKHILIEVSHNRSGSENTVSCPVCKIFWKYDCSG